MSNSLAKVHPELISEWSDRNLASLFPNVAAEWSERNKMKPTMVTAYSNQKVWWKCSKGHEWNVLISTRSYGSKCPYCSGIILLKGFNDKFPKNTKLYKLMTTKPGESA